MFCHFVWICGEIYTSLQNTCLFPMEISTRLLHVYFGYMSLNVVNYKLCYLSRNVSNRTPFLWNPWAFIKCVILVLSFLDTKIDIYKQSYIKLHDGVYIGETSDVPIQTLNRKRNTYSTMICDKWNQVFCIIESIFVVL